jgi:hypothetical protein
MTLSEHKAGSEKSVMTDREKMEFLGGQMHAFVEFAAAVIATHPYPAILARHFEKYLELNQASIGTNPSNPYVEGAQDVRNRLMQVVQMTVE